MNNNTQNQNTTQFIMALYGAKRAMGNALSPELQRKITREYKRMYFGLAMTMWTRNKTLGHAWQSAMDMAGTFVTTRNADNPAAQQLKKAHAEHRAKWSRVIMTNPNSQMKIPNNPELVSKLNAYGAKNTSDALNIINGILRQYEKQKPSTITQKPRPAPVKSAVGNAKVHTGHVAVNARPHMPGTPIYRDVKKSIPGILRQSGNKNVFAIAKQRMQMLLMMQMCQQGMEK